MRAYWKPTVISLGCLIALQTATAGPLATVYDSGRTQSIQNYLPEPEPSPAPPTLSPREFGFPIHSAKWTPGNFERSRINFEPLKKPFFVVGCDDISRSWLTRRKDALQSLDAIGFVIRCSSRQDYEVLAKHAFPLLLQPMEADAVADKLKHSIYPALISSQAIEQ